MKRLAFLLFVLVLMLLLPYSLKAMHFKTATNTLISDVPANRARADYIGEIDGNGNVEKYGGIPHFDETEIRCKRGLKL